MRQSRFGMTNYQTEKPVNLHPKHLISFNCDLTFWAAVAQKQLNDADIYYLQYIHTFCIPI